MMQSWLRWILKRKYRDGSTSLYESTYHGSIWVRLIYSQARWEYKYVQNKDVRTLLSTGNLVTSRVKWDTFYIWYSGLQPALCPLSHISCNTISEQSQSNLRARIEINCNQQIIVLDYSGLTFQLNVFKIECWSFVVISHINTTSENNG